MFQRSSNEGFLLVQKQDGRYGVAWGWTLADSTINFGYTVLVVVIFIIWWLLRGV